VKAKCSNTDVVVLPFDLADFNNANNHVEKSHFFFGKKLMSLINNGGVSQRSFSRY
jgi:hypothetical protein